MSVVATAGSVTADARAFQLYRDVELLRMDPGRKTEMVVWRLKCGRSFSWARYSNPANTGFVHSPLSFECLYILLDIGVCPAVPVRGMADFADRYSGCRSGCRAAVTVEDCGSLAEGPLKLSVFRRGAVRRSRFSAHWSLVCTIGDCDTNQSSECSQPVV